MATAKTSATNKKEEPIYVPIKVTTGILLHIGAGIYQSVAGALKELVSNSYDADATEVVISTDYPNFSEIKVVDNGDGMTATRLIQAMATVGSSLKVTLDRKRRTPEYKRPIIGKLGIGLMALSQVCELATIESQAAGSKTKFKATLDFSEFKKRALTQEGNIKLQMIQERFGGLKQMKKLLQDPQTDIGTKEEINTLLGVLEEARKKRPATMSKEADVEHLGYCLLYPDLPAIEGEQGTTITLTNIDSAVKELLRDAGRTSETLPTHYIEKGYTWPQYRDELNKLSWLEVCQALRQGSSKTTYALLPTYQQFLWELALMTPVQYFPNGPISLAKNVLKRKKKELQNYNFSLIVDNRSLLKPILLPSGAFAGKKGLEELYDYFIESLTFDEIVDNQRLKYHGYIFWQRKQAQPSSLRGIEIYIRNVGIGLYDRTLMNFSAVNITSRAGQMSGEIYVEEGLERALNVDRNSFRVTDEHYITLQQELWRKLGSAKRKDGIIGKSIDSYWLRKERSNEAEQKQHVQKLKSLVGKATAGKYEVVFQKRKSEKPFELEGNTIIVFDQSPQWPRSKQERRLYQTILIPVQVAVASGATSQRLAKLLESTLLASNK
jgi:histidine kinase/DNA gyrase B/HSP90-like ATPase